MNRHGWHAGLLLAGALAAGTPRAADETARWQRPEVILSSFAEIALRSEYGAASQRKTLAKWVSPIRIGIEHRVGEAEKHADLVRMHADHLASLTQHPIEIVKDASEANVRLIFSREERFLAEARAELGVGAGRIAPSATCMSSYRTHNGEITQATILIPVDRASAHRKLVACIVEELTQALGLPNDSRAVYPSIFNDHSTDHLLSGLDYLLLRILYDPRMVPGMAREDALRAAGTIVGEFKNQGVIRDAERLVSRGELYRLLSH
ncbi:MAG TPA: DUF2927 domain-containing protein [Methylococcaceae bacterium]|nr:DUF2927 domain-containing protein [Methylococcaceae bacterium]